jgi:sulfatase maturation enzyme AslB (radical SAM superfamily)
LTVSRQFFSRAGRQSEQARRCRNQRTGQAYWSCAASSPTACSPTAISVHGIAASTAWRDQVRRLQARLRSRVSSHFHHTGEELFYRGTQGSGTIFFTSCNMRCAFCQNGDISTDKDNGEETDPRTLAAMAWTLRREGCHNINWVGGEVVIHLHAIVDAIALLGRDFTPTQAELRGRGKTKADRFFWFDEEPSAAVYDGKFNAPMLGIATSS